MPAQATKCLMNTGSIHEIWYFAPTDPALRTGLLKSDFFGIKRTEPMECVTNYLRAYGDYNDAMSTKSWDKIKDDVYGAKGTPRRDVLECEMEPFRVGLLLKKAREQQQMTQEELARKVTIAIDL